MYVKEHMNLNLILIQIHVKDTIVKGANPNIFLKVAVGAERKKREPLPAYFDWLCMTQERGSYAACCLCSFLAQEPFAHSYAAFLPAVGPSEHLTRDGLYILII